MATSQYFEGQIAALRAEVDNYLELGVCVLPLTNNGLAGYNTVHMMCSGIAAHQNRPFVSVSVATNTGDRLLTIPKGNATKYLRSMFVLIGEKVDRHLYGERLPITYTMGGKMVVRFIGDSGKAVLDGWLESIKTDGNMRFELKLPPLPRK